MSARAVVAIDGPSGSGKSTTARAVAERLGLPVLDTGAMYRAATLAVLRAGVDPADATAAAEVTRRARIEVSAGVTRLHGEDVSEQIRGPEVTAAVSAVSAHPGVRSLLVGRQREWVDARGGGVVEGRDIGTVVFPDAPVKVYLTAGGAERARRRRTDEADGLSLLDLEAVQAALAARDAADSTRVASPLRPAEDALVIDTTLRSVDEVVDEIVDAFRGARD